MSETRVGLTLLKSLELSGMSLIDSSDSIPFVEVPVCPIDGGVFKTFVEMNSTASRQKVRVAVCESCGYVGYKDKPTEQWIKEFYSGDVWDSVSPEGESKEKKIRARSNASLDLLSKADLLKEGSVLDVGCGYGESLLYLKKLGFEKLYGIEHSPHRAKAARALNVGDIADGAFGDEASLKVLRTHAPYDVILCHHVLEHTYDPKKIIQAIASLQAEGDTFVLSVPDVSGEVTMTTFLFLPHLHAFSLRSLHELLAATGYGIVDFTADGRVLTVLAKKGAAAKIPEPARAHFRQEMIDKSIKALGLDRTYNYTPRRLFWDMKIDCGGQTHYFGNGVIDQLYFKLYALYLRLRLKLGKAEADSYSLQPYTQGLRSFLVTDCSETFLSASAPITLHSEGRLVLFYK